MVHILHRTVTNWSLWASLSFNGSVYIFWLHFPAEEGVVRSVVQTGNLMHTNQMIILNYG